MHVDVDVDVDMDVDVCIYGVYDEHDMQGVPNSN